MTIMSGEPTTADRRALEKAKYDHVYAALPDYRMGEVRKLDAMADLRWARALGMTSYLDIGCGRGEMLDFAESIGFVMVTGIEVVNQLCSPGRVMNVFIHDLPQVLPAAEFDFVTSFDVIEHLLPGDDGILIAELGRIARLGIALTANNKPSVDPTTGADLHINKREYDDWDKMIRQILEPVWMVERISDKAYVSETWRARR